MSDVARVPPPGVAVVIGANGGIGRALVDALVASGDYANVVAVSRTRPDGCTDVARRVWVHADILVEESLKAAANQVAGLGAPTRIIVATGVLAGPRLAPEKTMRALSAANLAESFAINTIGPALVAKHFLPVTPRDRPSLFAVLSARVGSIGDNRLGGWYGYRVSKAALNMMLRTLAIEHARTRPLGVCVALHPGTVDTALSAPFQSGVKPDKLFAPARSAAALLDVMNSLRPKDSGGFYAWDGAEIPW